TIDQVCANIMEIMRREFGDTGVTGVPLTDEERAKFLSSCAEDQDKELERLGADKFDVYVACVMAAATMESLMACHQSE
ncbi:MAG TPA: hypothetical protein VK034_10460, partial [Enhygromyxa sp.]|nr:hypothetical protein [Enhygromyxa sp.]